MHIPKFNSIRSVTSPIFAKQILKTRAIAKPGDHWVKTTDTTRSVFIGECQQLFCSVRTNEHISSYNMTLYRFKVS